jgi:type II secretory pathway component PulF
MSMRFRYAALGGGSVVEGSQEASSAEAVAEKLRSQGLLPLRIVAERTRPSLRKLLTTEVRLGSRISPSDLGAILYELGGLLVAGVTLNEAIAIIAEGRAQPRLRTFLGALDAAVRDGASLSDAFARHPNDVSEDIVAIVRAGEAAGSLGSTCARLASELQQREKRLSELRKALVYPAILAITALTVVLLLFLMVVPQLEGLFPEDAIDRLPPISHAVLAISHWLREWGAITAFVFGAIVILVVALGATGQGRRFRSGMALSLPMVRRYLRTHVSARFLRVFGSLLQGGVKTERALGIAVETVGNLVLRDRFREVHRRVIEGAALSEVLASTKLLGRDVISIVRVGERTGRLPEMTDRAAALYEERARSQVQTLVTLAGPVLTAALGLVAGIVAYAVLSTLLSVNELAFR